MPVWAWVVIVVGVVLVVALGAWLVGSRRRSGRLQSRFGPEYERTVETAGSKREAEAELAEREERREQLEVRPLSSAARERYLASWQTVQAEFVDGPAAAVVGADSLIQSVMAERGYPVDDFEQRAADVSVDHPEVVEHYRAGHRLSEMSANGEGSTEDLRQAMRHYRALFETLVETSSGAPAAELGDRDTGNEMTREQGRNERSGVSE
jgi:hypothetical protein